MRQASGDRGSRVLFSWWGRPAPVGWSHLLSLDWLVVAGPLVTAALLIGWLQWLTAPPARSPLGAAHVRLLAWTLTDRPFKLIAVVRSDRQLMLHLRGVDDDGPAPPPRLAWQAGEQPVWATTQTAPFRASHRDAPLLGQSIGLWLTFRVDEGPMTAAQGEELLVSDYLRLVRTSDNPYRPPRHERR